MDKKNKLTLRAILALCFVYAVVFSSYAQEVATVTFCDKEYGDNSDSLTLFLKVRDINDKMVDILSGNNNQLKVLENDIPISDSNRIIRLVTTGKRIPQDVTFSVLVDLGISERGKKQICDAIGALVNSAGDSSVFLSYFGDKVGRSALITRNNFSACCEELINKNAQGQRCFYSALYSKLTEFTPNGLPVEDNIPVDAYNYSYIRNPEVSDRSNKDNPEKNILFLFTESSYDALPEPDFTLPVFNKFQIRQEDYSSHIVPKVFAFVYTPDDAIVDSVMVNVLDFVGKYMPSNDFNTVITGFEEVVISEMCDYAYTYRVPEDKSYKGKKVEYKALWEDKLIGNGGFSIGTAESPWPKREQTTNSWVAKCLIALLLSLLAVLFYIIVMKVIIPGIKSLVFRAKYYNTYKDDSDGTQTIICPLCTREIEPGVPVVTRCKHMMHKKCWEDNDYQCVEYGQNCKEGIQEHIDWKDVFSIHSLRSSYLVIAGVCAGLVSWIIYSVLGNNVFQPLSEVLVRTFYHHKENAFECVTKVSSFLAIGLLLAFFLSVVFRYFDSIRKKDWRSLLQITGLSLLSSVIGIGSFALGGIILCLLLSPKADIPWWLYSMPAYLLFSVFTSLSLTIKSSIPAKSAILGGLVSAVIGSVVLYSGKSISDSKWDWMNMLLDFVIYGGGLGASIVTVRMLAEKYFLIIKNGVKGGQRIPIHKWMNASGGSNAVTIGMTQRCEIQMTWEKSNKVAKEHARLYVDHNKSQAMLKPMAPHVVYNSRTELPINKAIALSNNDTFTIGDTIFQYVES